jgi:hypothetical protein
MKIFKVKLSICYNNISLKTIEKIKNNFNLKNSFKTPAKEKVPGI